MLPADLEREEWSENTAFLLRLGLELLAGIAALTEQLPEAERRRVFPAALELFRRKCGFWKRLYQRWIRCLY